MLVGFCSSLGSYFGKRTEPSGLLCLRQYFFLEPFFIIDILIQSKLKILFENMMMIFFFLVMVYASALDCMDVFVKIQ